MKVMSQVNKDGSVRLTIKSESGQGGLEFELGAAEWEHFVRFVLTTKPVYPHPMSHVQRGELDHETRPAETKDEIVIIETLPPREVPFRHDMSEGYGDDGHIA